jgi:hypothetical protein
VDQISLSLRWLCGQRPPGARQEQSRTFRPSAFLMRSLGVSLKVGSSLLKACSSLEKVSVPLFSASSCSDRRLLGLVPTCDAYSGDQ